MTFQDRLLRRQRAWWPRPGRGPWRPDRLLHQFLDMNRLRSRQDDDTAWHCCDAWQRCLSNKWNAREFAVRHGCRVPELYWHGWRIGALPFASLPPDFVVRPAWGAFARGTYVMVAGRERLHDEALTRPELRARLVRDRGRLARIPLLVEEFVKPESAGDVLPIEYKFYTFGGHVAAIQVFVRQKPATRYSFLTADWVPLPDPMNTMRLPLEVLPQPPACFDAMIASARRLGEAYATFIRSDFYATADGHVFGEFAPMPFAGLQFTPFAERYFGDLWTTLMNDRT